jgi:LPS-assembly protein
MAGLLLVGGLEIARAQLPFEGVKGTEASAAPSGEIDIQADSLEYLSDKKLIIGTGNVVVREGADLLQADYVTVQRETRDVYARGNVVMRRAGTVWQGEELRYNLTTRQGDFGEFQAFVDPYYVRAEDSKRYGETNYLLQGVTITTCDGETPDFSFRAREARLENGTQLRARGVMMYFGAVPFFWLPKLNRNLAAHDTYWQFVPGYSSRNGAYLLSAYNYRLTKSFKGITRVDVRSEKGVGLGQEFEWKSRTNDLPYEGAIRGYYIDDQKPFRTDEEEEREKALVDNERYRLKLTHNRSYTARDYLISELNYVSDPEMIKDFFDEEYRSSVQPENRVSLAHRGDQYTAGLLLNTRLNDFYENVNRLPELSLDATRQELGDSGVYYESRNSASWLERVFPEDDDDEDYDAFRIDSGHTLYYPTRHFGFLNVTPRAGYRGTYYSDTFSSSTVSNDVVLTDSNGVVSVTNEIKDVVTAEGAAVRHVYELGFETSFKAFRAWEDVIVLDGGDGLRHVAEPYLAHTYIPEPNYTPDQLPQFDSVDELDKRHDLRIGMRNKLQTRYNKVPDDIVDLNVYTYYRIEKDEEDEDFSNVFFDGELRLSRKMPIDFDGDYDPYEGEFRTFNTQVAYLLDDASTIGLEYRYRVDDQNLIALETVLFPNARWSFQAYGRWDTEADGLQEHSYYVQRRSACLGYGLGFRQIVGDEDEKDDNQVWFQFWLLAFPESSIKLGGG